MLLDYSQQAKLDEQGDCLYWYVRDCGSRGTCKHSTTSVCDVCCWWYVNSDDAVVNDHDFDDAADED